MDLDTWWQQKLAAVDPTLLRAGVRSAWWSFSVSDDDAILENDQDINQAIAIITGTPRGADVHRPNFASDVFQHIDKPVPLATPGVIRETIRAIELWEPRVDTSEILVTPYIEGLASLRVQVQWRLIGTAGKLNVITIDIARA